MKPLICIEDVATGRIETREMNDDEHAAYQMQLANNEPQPTPEEETPTE